MQPMCSKNNIFLDREFTRPIHSKQKDERKMCGYIYGNNDLDHLLQNIIQPIMLDAIIVIHK